MRRRFTPPNADTWTRVPPLELMPKTVAEVYAELRSIERQHTDAANELHQLRTRAHQDESEAKRADAQQAAEAARAGESIGATPNLDALRAKREAAEARVNALRDALELVRGDATTAKHAAVEDARQAAAVARADLHAAAEAMTAALTRAMQATALAEWLTGDHPFDANPLVPIVDLGVENIGPVVHTLPPAVAPTILAVIAAMTDPDNTNQAQEAAS